MTHPGDGNGPTGQADPREYGDPYEERQAYRSSANGHGQARGASNAHRDDRTDGDDKVNGDDRTNGDDEPTEVVPPGHSGDRSVPGRDEHTAPTTRPEDDAVAGAGADPTEEEPTLIPTGSPSHPVPDQRDPGSHNSDPQSEEPPTERAPTARPTDGRSGSGQRRDGDQRREGDQPRDGHAPRDGDGDASRNGDGDAGEAGAEDRRRTERSSERNRRRRRNRRGRSRRRRLPRGVLLRMAGIDPHYVRNSMDRARYSTAAMAMLLYGVIATAGFTYFLMIATGNGPWPLALVGALIALAVMLYDRMLLANVNVNMDRLDDPSAPVLARAKIVGYLIRVLIALLTAVVVTHPLTLKLFKSEIDGELGHLSAIKLEQLNADVDTERQKRIDQLKPPIEKDRQALTTASDDVTRLDKEVTRESSGQGPTGEAGCGPECHKLLEQYNDAVQRRADANTKLTNDLAGQRPTIDTINREQDAKIAANKSNPPKVGGVLNQETALWQVLGHSRPALVRYLLVTALFLVIDIAVLLAKLSSRKSPYDLAMADAIRRTTVAEREVESEEIHGSRRKRLRVLGFRDRTGERRAERQEDDDLDIHRSAYLDREGRRRQIEDRAELRTAADVFAHEKEMKRRVDEAAFEMFTHSLQLERRIAEARLDHERAMRALGVTATPVGSGPPSGPPSQPPAEPTGPPPTQPQPRAGLMPGDRLGGRWELIDQELPKREKAQSPCVLWRARDLRGEFLGDLVVKATIVPEDDRDRRARRQALTEMELAADDFVVEVLDKRDEGDLLWFVMPYYPLGSLWWYMKNRAPKRPLRQVLAIVDHILQGLESQPRKSHGDIKPENIVVAQELSRTSGDGLPEFTDLYIRVIDWGVSKLWTVMIAQLQLTVTGTQIWRAPEQREGRTPDPRSDLYAVAGILYWLVSGTRAFEINLRPNFTEGRIEALQRDGAYPELLNNLVPEVPRSLAKFVNDLLSYRPENRLPGVAAKNALQSARDQLGAIALEVAETVRNTGTEIMVGAIGGFGPDPDDEPEPGASDDPLDNGTRDEPTQNE